MWLKRGKKCLVMAGRCGSYRVGLWPVAEEEDGSLHRCFCYSVEKSSWVWKIPDSLLNPVFSYDPVKITSHFWSFCLGEVFR